MKKISQKYWKHALFTVVGATLGLAYWKFVGCTSGTCPITANWHTSVLFGSLIGMLAVPARKSIPKDVEETERETLADDKAQTNNNSNIN